MRGLILDKGEEYFSFLGKIFYAIKDSQKEYNWLITNYECYPQTKEYSELFSEDYLWLTGDQLSQIIEDEDFQWIWGVLSGFDKSIKREDALQYNLPIADGYEGFWKNPIKIQHPLADIEIVAFDSTLTLFLSKKLNLLELFQKNFPLAEDLEEYNKN